jgi:hypothetical protein
MPFITQTTVTNPPKVEVGTVTTGDPNTPAQVVNAGTTQNVVLNFTIPKGVDGITFSNIDGGDADAIYTPIEPFDAGGAS